VNESPSENIEDPECSENEESRVEHIEGDEVKDIAIAASSGRTKDNRACIVLEIWRVGCHDPTHGCFVS
jgi:hypothetical protein